MTRQILTPFSFTTGGNIIASHSAGVIPLAIRGASSTPTVDLLSIQNSGGTPLSGFDSAANLFVNKTSYGTSIVSSGPASVTFWKIATLPVSSAGSYDHVILDVVLDDNWGSAQKVTARILFSNRDTFTFRYYLNGTVRSAARVLAYTEANGTVSIYLRAGNGNFCTFSYNITHGVDPNLSINKNPASTTTTPTGTLAFDSSAIGTYVPESYIPYTGQPIIRGLVNSSGAVIGASFNGITGLSSTTPAALGTAAVGTATTAARADHVHATPTTVVATVSGTNSAELVRGNMADNDQFRILVGGTATNTGFAEIATADDGTEPIHVRQYTGVFTTLVRTATLLDASGNTTFPGTLSAVSKSFLIDHPTKPGKKLRYGSLEGPENGVYVRGTVTDGVIELPEYWAKLVDPESITVSLTPVGKFQKLYVEKIDSNKIYISGSRKMQADYVVFAERVDIAKMIVEE